MQVPENELKSFILDSGLVSRKEIDAAESEAKERGRSIGDILVSQGALSSDALRRVKAYVLGIQFVDLKHKRIPFDVLSIIPEPVARTHGIIAYQKGEGELGIAMLDTEDLPAIDAIKKKTGLKILIRLTDEESIKKALLQYQKSLKEEFGDLIASEASKIRILKEVPGEAMSAEDLKKVAEELPVVRIVDALLRHAVIQGASDIHIEPMEEALLIRYRIDGMLRDAMTLPRHAALAITSRLKILSNLPLTERNRPQDGRFKMETDSERVSFRVSLLPTYFGEKTVMRVLRETGEGFTLDVLGFHGEGLEKIHRATKERGGLILIAGPTGSGKTTTLYTVLDILNTPDVNISTIEDPIEYQMRRVSQSQVDAGIGFTFANGLRSLLRQDPDIIAVGELRDGETAALAVHAAMTGHLVLATISANSAAGAVSRLLGMGVDPFLLSSALKLVVGQRLVRKLAIVKEQYLLSKEERDSIAPAKAFTSALRTLVEEKLVKNTVKMDNIPFCRPQPSQESDDGYQGRIGLQEVMVISSGIRSLILDQESAEAIQTQAQKEGMETILEDGIYKAARGITSLEEAIGAQTA